MRLTTRIIALEREAERARSRSCSGAVDVCARIGELTVLYTAHPPTLPPAVEAGIQALLARDESFAVPESGATG